MRVAGALEGLPCIFELAVDVPGGMVTVSYDAHRCTPEDLVRRLRERGYAAGEASPPRAR